MNAVHGLLLIGFIGGFVVAAIVFSWIGRRKLIRQERRFQFVLRRIGKREAKTRELI